MTNSPEEVVVSPVSDERVVTGSGFTEKPFQGKVVLFTGRFSTPGLGPST